MIVRHDALLQPERMIQYDQRVGDTGQAAQNLGQARFIGSGRVPTHRRQPTAFGPRRQVMDSQVQDRCAIRNSPFHRHRRVAAIIRYLQRQACLNVVMIGE
jgi:hypothetical protein